MRYRSLIALTLIAFSTAVPFVVSANISQTLVSTFGIFTGFGGMALNWAINTTVLNMAGTVSTVGVGKVINDIWTIIRDLINLTFVFGLIYAGVLTIVKGIDQSHVKQMLKSIIIAALLVNFSLIFTKVIIDLSNSASFAIYNQFSLSLGEREINQDCWVCMNYGIAGAFMNQMGLVTLLDSGKIGTEQADKIAEASSEDGGIGYIIVGSFFMIIAGLIFFAGALLLLIRFVVLIFLMMFSPIMFGLAFIPQLSKMREKWMHSLMSQAIFAPAFLFTLWIAYMVLAGIAGLDTAPPGSLFNAITDPKNAVDIPPDTRSPVFAFMMSAAFLVAALVVAKEMGATGASAVNKWATKTMGALTIGASAAASRATLGRASYKIANSESLLENASKSGFGGWSARRALNLSRKGAASSYDVRSTKLGQSAAKGAGVDLGDAHKGGYEGKVKEIKEADKRYGESLGKVGDDDPLVMAMKQRQKDAEHKLAELKNEKEVAKAKGNKDEMNKLDGLIHTQDDKVNKAKEAVEQEKNRRQIGSAITTVELADKEYLTIKNKLDEETMGAKTQLKNAVKDLAKATTIDEKDVALTRVVAMQKTIKDLEGQQKKRLLEMRRQSGASTGYVETIEMAGMGNSTAGKMTRSVINVVQGRDGRIASESADNFRKNWKTKSKEKKEAKPKKDDHGGDEHKDDAHPPAAGGDDHGGGGH